MDYDLEELLSVLNRLTEFLQTRLPPEKPCDVKAYELAEKIFAKIITLIF
jgi:hypothetical protein